MRTFLIGQVAGLALLTVLAGCEYGGGYADGAGYDGAGRRPPATPEEMIRTDADTYDVGQVISMRLTNRTGRTVSYNLCRSQLQRRAGDDWMVVQQSLAEVCTAELRGLGPGRSVTFAFRMPGVVRSGPYRIRTELRDPRGGQIEAVSNTFSPARERND